MSALHELKMIVRDRFNELYAYEAKKEKGHLYNMGYLQALDDCLCWLNSIDENNTLQSNKQVKDKLSKIKIPDA